MSQADFNFISIPLTSIDGKMIRNEEMIKDNISGFISQSQVEKFFVKQSLKSFNCPNCQSCFSQNRNLTRHLKYECGQPPRFQCPYCNFRSKQTSNVLAHIRSQHAGKKPYVHHLKRET